MIGTLIGQYRIISVIGSGGMGTVYAGEHTLIRRRAAIKVLRPELSQRPEVAERFFNEARAVAAINHPGVVQIYDFGNSEDGHGYIVMEQLDGETLKTRLARGALELPDALRVIRQAASAVGAAHDAGIIHRDLKPDNIFLLADPEIAGGVRVKILDFGIAKLGEEFAARITETGTMMGTPTYMAPEQFDGVVDQRSDLYALGCVLFETLVGQPPFADRTLARLTRSHLDRPPPTPSSLKPALTTPIDTLVLRCLEKDPARRFQTMGELIAVIDGALPAVERGLRAAPPADDSIRERLEQEELARARAEAERLRTERVEQERSGKRKASRGSKDQIRQKIEDSGSDEPPAEPSSDTIIPSQTPESQPLERPTPAAKAVAAGPAPSGTSYGPPPVMPHPAPGSRPQAAPLGQSYGRGGSFGTKPSAVVAATAAPAAISAGTIVTSAPPIPSLARETAFVRLRRLLRSSIAPVTRLALGDRGSGELSLFPSAMHKLGLFDDDDDRKALVTAFESVVPPSLVDWRSHFVEFFGSLFGTAEQFNGYAVRLGAPAIADLRARDHYVLFLDDPDGAPPSSVGNMSTMLFVARVTPLAEQLFRINTPPGSVVIAVLAAPQLGQGARETIFKLRTQRNLFIVPLAAAEIRHASEAGTARVLLRNRIADLHTVSDPFAVLEDFTDPTRCIGFAGEVADLIKHITRGGQIVSIAGPPGSGKTSVIAMAQYGCDTKEVARRFIRIECSELTNLTPDGLIRELQSQIARIDSGIGPRHARGSVSPTAPVSTPTDEPAATPTDGNGGAALDTGDLRETIMKLGARADELADAEDPALTSYPATLLGVGVAPTKRHQLVIVLEDADRLIRLASSAEPDAALRRRARELWRGLAQLCSSGGHTVIVTSVRDFQVMDQVPLERPVEVARVPMRALARQESDRIVMSIGELVGFSPTRRALAKLHDASGGNVYALRLLCSNVIRATREQPDYSPLASLEVTAKRVDEAIEHTAATGPSFRPHVAVWLEDIERIVLQHVARDRPRGPRRIRRALEGTATNEQIVKALDALELMGLVESRRGRHRVRIPLLELWINTHLDPPQRRQAALRQARISRIAIGCTVTALIFGAYWTWLRSTRSASAHTLGNCEFELDYPDRIGAEESLEIHAYQSCKPAERHDLALETLRSKMEFEDKVTTTCSATTASCTTTFKLRAGTQAGDTYQVQLHVDGAEAISAAIQKDRFAAVRAIGEKTVPTIAFLPLLLSVALAFHKDLKRSITAMFQRSGDPPLPPAPPAAQSQPQDMAPDSGESSQQEQ